MANDDQDSTALPDLTGTVVVVTGASSGIGAASARALAGAGAKVVLAVRDTAKGERIAATMTGDTEVRSLDLENLASVRGFAAAWSGPIDVLINNAGVMLVPEARTADGFERQIGTNHLGHFVLTNLLLPHITGRIVTVASNAHARGHLDLGDLNWHTRPYDSSQAYSDSKLANLLFTFELQRRLSASGSSVRAMAVHPGMVRTNLFGHRRVLGSIIDVIGRFAMQDPAHGAQATLFAAAQDIPGGSFVQPGGFGHLRGAPGVSTAAPSAYDTRVAAELWALSVRLTSTDAPLAHGRHALARHRILAPTAVPPARTGSRDSGTTKERSWSTTLAPSRRSPSWPAWPGASKPVASTTGPSSFAR